MRQIVGWAASSASATYGNINQAIMAYLLDRFPAGMFKYTHVSTELAFRSIRKQMMNNTNNDVPMTKRERPWLILSPRYTPSVNKRDLFMHGTFATKHTNDIVAFNATDARFLFSLMEDKDNGVGLHFRINRKQIEFEITLTFESINEQQDILSYIENSFSWDDPFYVVAPLESVIPRVLMWQMGKYGGIDINNPDTDEVGFLLRYVNKLARQPVTYKIRNSSGRDEYFMYYNHRLLVTFSELSVDTGSRKGMIEDMFNITFTCTVDFNLPGMWYLQADYSRQVSLEADMRVYNGYGDTKPDIIPLFTIDNLFSRFPPTYGTFRRYAIHTFMCEPENGIDIVSYDDLMDAQTLVLLKEYHSKGINPTSLMQFFIIANGQLLHEEEDFFVDWNNFNLRMINPDKDTTYRVAIYVDQLQFNLQLGYDIEHTMADMPNL